MSNWRLKGHFFFFLPLIDLRERERESVCSSFRQGIVRSHGDPAPPTPSYKPITFHFDPTKLGLAKDALQVRIQHQNAGRLSGSACFFFSFLFVLVSFFPFNLPRFCSFPILDDLPSFSNVKHQLSLLSTFIAHHSTHVAHSVTTQWS